MPDGSGTEATSSYGQDLGTGLSGRFRSMPSAWLIGRHHLSLSIIPSSGGARADIPLCARAVREMTAARGQLSGASTERLQRRVTFPRVAPSDECVTAIARRGPGGVGLSAEAERLWRRTSNLYVVNGRSSRTMRLVGAASIVFILAMAFATSGLTPPARAEQTAVASERERAARLRDGRAIFRFDTFGDEQLWTDTLRMHEVIPAVDPVTALAVGLKVDAEALPPGVVAALRAGQVDLTNPAVTVELLRLNAVVGVKGTVEDGRLTK